MIDVARVNQRIITQKRTCITFFSFYLKLNSNMKGLERTYLCLWLVNFCTQLIFFALNGEGSYLNNLLNIKGFFFNKNLILFDRVAFLRIINSG